MNDVAYCSALAVAAVFAWAGIAKLRRPRRTRRGFAALGVPAGLARVVPAIELALAAALLAAPSAGVVAAALLVAFTVVLARAREGVGCACFGGASTAPVSGAHLVRNALLAGAALLGSVASPVVPGLAAVTVVAGAVAVVAVGLALAELGRRTGGILRVELP